MLSILFVEISFLIESAYDFNTKHLQDAKTLLSEEWFRR